MRGQATRVLRTVHARAPRVPRATWHDFFRGFDEDGADQGFFGEPEPFNEAWFAPDPRGGYVETRVRFEVCNDGGWLHVLELRWVDEALAPRTPWSRVTSWSYSYNVGPQVLVDARGNALVLVFFDPPMSMPCHGAMVTAAWLTEAGGVTAFKPTTPLVRSSACGEALQYRDPGAPVALPDGGFAFYAPPDGSTVYPEGIPSSGWYAYASNSPVVGPAPEWLSARTDAPQRLTSGAYASVRRDPASCARTVEVLGPAGQSCASLPLEPLGACTAADRADQLTPEGTLMAYDAQACTVRWWPRLAAAH